MPLPSHFSLRQNYPNPFNPETKISYALPSREWVTLKIFNILGEEVALLADGFRDAGYGEAVWHAGHYPSGMYVARLTVTSSSGSLLYDQTKKLMLLK